MQFRRTPTFRLVISVIRSILGSHLQGLLQNLNQQMLQEKKVKRIEPDPKCNYQHNEISTQMPVQPKRQSKHCAGTLHMQMCPSLLASRGIVDENPQFEGNHLPAPQSKGGRGKENKKKPVRLTGWALRQEARAVPAVLTRIVLTCVRASCC